MGNIKKLTAALIGAGNRGNVYANYALECPDELQIVAVVEPNRIRREEAQACYQIAQEYVFENVKDFLAAKIGCDFVINATMDEQHYETAKQLISAGYDMLLEKPIVPNKEQLLDLKSLAEQKGVRINVCHVLRYTPFYKGIKEIINSGKIGKIMTIELNEHVWMAHFLDSFIRGKWSSKEKCGSGFLLQKSCHDMDLLCWLNNSTAPKKVFSFGSRSQFIPENAPDGATEFCYQCPHNATCNYSAQKVHLEVDGLPFQTWMGLHKPIAEITKEEKAEYLKHSTYGRCAYNSGGDINDRQVVCVEFENGSTASFTMVGGTCKSDRWLHVVGTHGELEGNLRENAFILRVFDRSGDNYCFREERIDVSKLVHDSVEYGGHGGGDYAIMYELVRYLNGDESSVSISTLEDSINSHLVVFAAEESVDSGKAVEI